MTFQDWRLLWGAENHKADLQANSAVDDYVKYQKSKIQSGSSEFESYTKTQLHDEKALDWAANNSKNLKGYQKYPIQFEQMVKTFKFTK